MADSYEVLYGKYQRAIISINELEQERDLYMQQAEELRQEHKMVEKNVTTLCETILKKEQEKQGEKKWFKMSVDELIAAAQTSIEGYYPKIDEKVRQVLDLNERRGKEIRELKKELADQKEKYENELATERKKNEAALSVVRKNAEKGSFNADELEKDIKKAQDDIKTEEAREEETAKNLELRRGSGLAAAGGVLTAEESDQMEEPVGGSIGGFYTNGIYKDVSGPAVYNDAKAQKKINAAVVEEGRKVQERAAREAKEAEAEAKTLDPKQKMLIHAVGATGYSEWSQITDYVRKQLEKESEDGKSASISDTAMRAVLQRLREQDIMSKTKVSVPGSTNLALYKLTPKGENLYRALYGKAPVEAFMDAVARNHDNLEHGYGIIQTAKLIEDMKFLKDQKSEIIYMTRTKEYEVKTGEHTSYIPDIVILTEQGDKKKKYMIEYETSKCTDADFFAKCSKIASFSKYINIVVPDKDAKEKTIEKTEKWKKRVLDEKNGPAPHVMVNISSYADLKNTDNTDGIEWDTKIPVRKNETGKNETKQ